MTIIITDHVFQKHDVMFLSHNHNAEKSIVQ